MPELFRSGNAIWVIFGFMLLEIIVVIIVRKKHSIGLGVGEVLSSLSAGAALLMALRASLKGDDWSRMALWLVVALVFHLWDLSRRWSARRTS